MTAKIAFNTLSNPFVAGETVKVPAGTPFRTDDPKFDRFGGHTMKRAGTFTVEYTYKGNMTHLMGQPYESKATVNVIGANGYMRYYDVTEELLKANGKEVTFDEVFWEPREDSK